MRRLHRRNHAELGEARNVYRIDNLRVFNSPPRFLNLPLVRRDRFERAFVEVENHPIGAITNCVCLDLNASTQCFLKHRFQLFRFFGEVTGSLGRIAVWLEQRRAADGFGILFSTRSIALSSNIPVGSPLALSFRISPPNGFGVVLSILAILSAAEFAIAPWPSARVRKTGLRGAILSRSCRVGNWGGFQKVSIQPRPVIHWPRLVLVTRAFTLPKKSSSVFAPSR